MTEKLAVFIVGPTGSGKTSVSVELAKKLGTEIISTDSRQVFREMKIGTAMPTPPEMKGIPHHLLAHRSIHEEYNASKFELEAVGLLGQLFSKYSFVLLTGGSGMYVKAVIEGIDDLPSPDPAIRKSLVKRMEEEGPESLRFELKKLDPASYDTIDLKNPARILRALEISLSSGKPYSSFLTRQKKERDFLTIKIGIQLERDDLYQQIDRRVERMMEAGLLDEARDLHGHRGLTALKTVGYTELFDHFEGKHSLDEAIRLIKRNSRRYARRQLTWFRADQEIRWFPPADIAGMLKSIKTGL